MTIKKVTALLLFSYVKNSALSSCSFKLMLTITSSGNPEKTHEQTSLPHDKMIQHNERKMKIAHQKGDKNEPIISR